jgi:hypothetical protein
MTINVWSPASNENSGYKISIDFLKSLINRIETSNNSEITNLLSVEEQQKHKSIMTQEKEQWQKLATKLESEELVTLIRFFTLAEVTYEEWGADEKSPVISLAKSLRQRGYSLDKELLKWIKENNPNKFLPYGPLL